MEIEDNSEISRATLGKEIGELSTPHIQGCFTFAKAKRFNFVVSLLEEWTLTHLHVEKARTFKAAHEYCQKEGNYYEKNLSRQGERTDLQLASQMILDGESLRDLAMKYPTTFVKYHNGFKALLYELITPSYDKPHVVWHYGPTGCGKSMAAQSSAGPSALHLTSDGVYCSPYRGETIVIWNDFSASQLPFRLLLKLLDYPPSYLRVLGAYVPWRATHVYFTTEVHPRMIYKPEVGDMDQLMRRIDKLYSWDYDFVTVLK